MSETRSARKVSPQSVPLPPGDFLKSLAVVAAGKPVTASIEITLTPHQWFSLAAIAKGKKQTLGRVFDDYVNLDDSDLLAALGDYEGQRVRATQ